MQTIPYDEIIEIDDVGDDLLKVPTIFARFREGRPPYLLNSKPEFTLDHGGFIPVPHEGHVRVFPERFRDESWETGWFGRNNAAYSKAPFSIPDDEETPGAGA